MKARKASQISRQKKRVKPTVIEIVEPVKEEKLEIKQVLEIEPNNSDIELVEVKDEENKE